MLGLSAATSSSALVGEAKEQRLKPLKRKAEEKDLFFNALDKYGKRSYEIPRYCLTHSMYFPPTQVKNYFSDKKKTIARQKESKEKMPKASVKAVKAAALPADHAYTMEGKKKKKTKKGKKEAACETPSKVDTPKKLTPSTDITDSSRLGAVSTENTRDSYSETELIRVGSELVVQHASGQDQAGEYRQHQFRLHQQQQQLQLQLQQQNLERLVQQQQVLIYRQQMQQEELYRQHLRQQEMLQAAQHALQLQQQHQHAHRQCQPYAEQRQNWNQLDRKCWDVCFFPSARLYQLKYNNSFFVSFFRAPTLQLAIDVGHTTTLSDSPSTARRRTWKHWGWWSAAAIA